MDGSWTHHLKCFGWVCEAYSFLTIFIVRKEYALHPSEKKTEKRYNVGISSIASSFAINPTYVGISTNFEFLFRYNEFCFDQINFIAI